jgi:hypothetical protein
MVQNPLIISGKEILRAPFQATTSFYPGYTWQVANASQLDIASAIGAVRRSAPVSLSQRLACLQHSARSFVFSQEILAHTVQATGMPISLVSTLFNEIPGILEGVADVQGQRFFYQEQASAFPYEKIGADYQKILVPAEGFCYAVTPGIDPRAAAILAANLGYLGIPFIIRASIRDAAAPLVIKALITGGFDPNFCQLIYTDREDPQASQKHFKLLDASAIVWTFGPDELVDRQLRYEITGHLPLLDLSGYPDQAGDLPSLYKFLSGKNRRELEERLRVEQRRSDHFSGKLVLRHNAGNCAAVACGSFNQNMHSDLSAALGFAVSCTATRAIMLVDAQDWIIQAADYLSALVVGDPLDPATQVGYIDPRCLDYLAELVQKNRLRLRAYGGKRRSLIQADPLLVASQEEITDFLGQEIPAYVIAVRECAHVAEAIDTLNRMDISGVERLAVSFYDLPPDQRNLAATRIRAHTVLFDRPTTTLLPFLHEGNDYALALSRPRLLVNL